MIEAQIGTNSLRRPTEMQDEKCKSVYLPGECVVDHDIRFKS